MSASRRRTAHKEKGGPGTRLAARTAKGSKAKPRARARGKTAEQGGIPGARREIPGLILLAFVLVTLVALISEQVQPGMNVLGPHVGTWWAEVLNNGLGKLPVLFHLAALVLVGVQIVFRVPLWKQASLAGAVGLFLGLLLSIRNLNPAAPFVDYPWSGGWLGNFLSQQIYVPVFGTESQEGPYLLTILLIALLMVWAFQISVSAWVKRGAHAAGVLGRTVAEGWRSVERTPAPGPVGEGDRDDGEARKPARAGRGTRAALTARPNEALIPTAYDTPEEEQAKLDVLLERGSLEGLDPLTIRKLRDLAQERRRVTELNDWEEKTRETEIGGLLGRGRPRDGVFDPVGAVPESGDGFPFDSEEDAFGEDALRAEDPGGETARGAGRSRRKTPGRSSLARRAPGGEGGDGEGPGRVDDDGTPAP
ncbi:MAG TPA: hypothetical protein VKZ88_03490, partial [Fibrobacteria bacterium]|nr:hypothetical protein [Fibrobacteria bacterium]